MTKQLNAQDIAFLNEVSDNLDSDTFFLKARFIKRVVSHFPAFLTQQEAQNQLVSYKGASNTPNDFQIYFQREAQCLGFFISFYSSYSTYLGTFEDDGGTARRKIYQKDEFVELCKEGLREEAQYALILPRLRLVFSIDGELGVVALYEDAKAEPLLEKNSKKHGLYLLNPELAL